MLGVQETYECYDCQKDSELVKQQDDAGKTQCLTCAETLFVEERKCVLECKSHIFKTTSYGTRFCVQDCNDGVLTQDAVNRDHYQCSSACDKNLQVVAGHCVQFNCASSESYNIQQNLCSSTCDYKFDETGNRYCTDQCRIRYQNASYPAATQCVDACPLDSFLQDQNCVPKDVTLNACTWGKVECALKFQGRVIE